MQGWKSRERNFRHHTSGLENACVLSIPHRLNLECNVFQEGANSEVEQYRTTILQRLMKDEQMIRTCVNEQSVTDAAGVERQQTRGRPNCSCER